METSITISFLFTSFSVTNELLFFFQGQNYWVHLYDLDVVCLCSIQLSHLSADCVVSFSWNIPALSHSLSLAIFRSCISLAPSSRAICQTRSHQAYIHTLAHNHIRVISIRLHMNNRRAILKFGQHTQTHTKAQQ